MSGEFNGFVLLGVLWFLLSLMTRGRSKLRGSTQSQRPAPPLRGPTPSGPDATQQEGFRLESVLRELQRSLEEAARPARLPNGPVALPGELDGSLEMEPEARSLEGQVEREGRRRVDLDDDAADVETRRIQAAAKRDAPRTRQAQPTAIQTVQQQPAEHTAGRTYTAQQLRDAVVWREILGPPVSMRDQP
jgi:hypothetical protein